MTDFESLLSELDQWRQQAPGKHDIKRLPQQNHDRVQATYLQAVLLVIRPILMDNAIDPDLTRLCVEFAADACQVGGISGLSGPVLTVAECQNPQSECADPPRPDHSVPLLLLRDHTAAVPGHHAHSIGPSTCTPGYLCLPECVVCVHTSTA